VIMYADKLTDSMDKAISETNRRRILQLQYNEQNGIIPQTIIKPIGKLLEITMPLTEKNKKEKLKPEEIKREINSLEKEMLDAARNLDFEKAAHLRDAIKMLRLSLVKDE